MSTISRLLIANRGEIACRVIKTARKMGVETVSVFSEADRGSQHVALADRSICIGPAPALQSYLRVDHILEAARITGSQAIHPGYGFLSESAEFAEQCTQKGFIFVGPPPSAIRDMGIKSTSKYIMEKAGVPVIKGYHGSEQSVQHLLMKAKDIGFPIMIKAVRGGGGKGMRISYSESDFLEQLESAKREARKSFNDEVMLLEQYIERPRHVEVQVFADTHGNCVYLFERDCSIQRRHQKVIEEAGAPGLTAETRRQLGEAAVQAAKAVGYVGAGTVEFIMDAQKRFFFMEMNTRLQVEHPVTELVTGQDLVEWQLRVAAGEYLPMTQDKISVHGHSFEARIYAEDTSGGKFIPAAGKISRLETPQEETGVLRVETGVRSGDTISVHYDPMIAKLVVWGEDRLQALSRLRYALQRFRVAGIPTNLAFLRSLTEHPELAAGNVHTDFIKEHSSVLLPAINKKRSVSDLASAGVAWRLKEGAGKEEAGFRVNLPLERNLRLEMTSTDGEQTVHDVVVTKLKGCSQESQQFYKTQIDGCDPLLVNCLPLDAVSKTETSIEADGLVNQVRVVSLSPSQLDLLGFNQLHSERQSPAFMRKLSSGTLGGASSAGLASSASPMPGVVEKLLVSVGDKVTANQPLATLMAMKMELVVRAGRDGTVSDILVREGVTVSKGQVLVRLEKIPEDDVEV